MTRKSLALSVAAAALSIGAAQAQTITVNGGGGSSAYSVYSLQYGAYTKANPSTKFSYEAVGSSGGQNAFFANDITQFENLAPGTLTYGTISGTTVHFGASDAYVSSGGAYNIDVGYPGAYSYTNTADGASASSATSGPLIQIPTFGTPITIAFQQTPYAGKTLLTLTDDQICGVFSGTINDWTTLTAGKVTGSPIIDVAVRSDGSGNTFLFTQHLSSVCTTANSAFPAYPVPVTKYFYNSSSKASNYIFATLPSNFTGYNTSGPLQAAIINTPGTLGYLSPDYTDLAASNTPNYSAVVQVASVRNVINNTVYAPISKNVVLGLANPLTVQPKGKSYHLAKYTTVPNTLSLASDPLNWVPQIPMTKSGYPIVGYTTEDLSTCYQVPAIGTAIETELTDNYKNKTYTGIITSAGFATLPVALSKAVLADFLSNTSGYNLDIDDATTCASYTPGR